MENKLTFKVSFGNDSPENYHLNVATTIQLGLLEKDELWLSTISAEEAMLICIYFTKQTNIVNNTFQDLVSVRCEGGCKDSLFIFKYSSKKIAKQALINFSTYYKQIYDEFSGDKNINSINEIYNSKYIIGKGK